MVVGGVVVGVVLCRCLWIFVVTFMRCASYCTCDSYDLKGLYAFLSGTSVCQSCSLHAGGTVLHMHYEGVVDAEGTATARDAFVFHYGCVVLWGWDEGSELALINSIASCGRGNFDTPVVDVDLYRVLDGQDSYVDTEDDIMYVKGGDTFVLLAFSCGLSQSVKLITFEDSVDRTIEENKQLPFELMNTGQTSLSRQGLAKKIGSLFAKRHLVTLSSSILDTPEFFWKRPKYEPYYDMTISNLELKQRISVLNDKLNIIHELYSFLSDELQQSNSSRLEWIIIALISLEAVISVLRDVLKIF